MLTVVTYRGKLFYVTSASMSNADGRYIDGLGVDEVFECAGSLYPDEVILYPVV